MVKAKTKTELKLFAKLLLETCFFSFTIFKLWNRGWNYHFFRAKMSTHLNRSRMCFILENMASLTEENNNCAKENVLQIIVLAIFHLHSFILWSSWKKKKFYWLCAICDVFLVWIAKCLYGRKVNQNKVSMRKKYF